ncbi:MAG TPA: ankyrin repeat domain-containing protein [Candidatus Babeliales bacterium]|nr:ankyrin repeat domain-containing protein [Candidatus Babeliales bacterium]
MNKYYIALLWIMIFFELTVFAMDELIKCSDAATYVITFCDTQTKNALGKTSSRFNYLCSHHNLDRILSCNSSSLTKKQKEYALLWAVQRKKYITVENLLKCDADANANNLFLKLHPLTIAQHNNDSHMIQLLQSYGSALSVNAPIIPPFVIATFTKDIQALQKCIKEKNYEQHYVCKHWNNNNILYIAAVLGDANIFEILLKEEVWCKQLNIANTYKLTPIIIAVSLNHIEIIKLLAAQKTITFNSANSEEPSALYVAAQNGYNEVIKILLAHKEIHVNELFNNKHTPLHIASFKGNMHTVQLLLTDKNINAIFTGEATPLYVATQQGHLDCVKILCLANPNAINICYFKYSPLHVASYNGQIEIVKHLLSYKNINTSLKTLGGETPLSIACHNKHSEIVTILLKHSPYVINECNIDGNSPLHIAVKFGDTAIIKLLVNTKEVNINSVNDDNKTPLDLVKLNKIKITKILRKHGALCKKDLWSKYYLFNCWNVVRSIW